MHLSRALDFDKAGNGAEARWEEEKGGGGGKEKQEAVGRDRGRPDHSMPGSHARPANSMPGPLARITG